MYIYSGKFLDIKRSNMSLDQEFECHMITFQSSHDQRDVVNFMDACRLIII